MEKIIFESAEWITPFNSKVTEEPYFSLRDMFMSGKNIENSLAEERLLPPKYLFKEFDIQKKEIVKAEIKITSHGLYKAYVNGEIITNAIFTPDYTSYDHYLQYQIYDITSLIKQKNIWSIILADGWYAGRVSVPGGSAQFGDTLSVIAEITITYIDGDQQTIGTDGSFVSTIGKYTYSDIFIGEQQDFTKDINLTKLPVNCDGVVVNNELTPNLIHQSGPQVIEKETINPYKIWKENDEIVIDFGQVLAGYLSLNIFLEFGQKIIVEHSEVLDEEGKFINNIVGRNKDQVDKYIGRGQVEQLKPDFTFHGFRYVRINGLEETIEKDQAKAIVIFSDMKETGFFETNNEDINKLMSNIKWSQKGNMISIPTDCPQRERVGWTGDMQVFAPTATFFYDVKDFLIRWLDNVSCEQQENGEILDYTPAPKDFFKNIDFTGSYSSAGWGDAIVMVPWELYKKYADITILERYYDAMIKWHEFSKKSAKGDKDGMAQYIWDTKFHYGDWMFPSFMIGENTPGPMKTAEVTKDIVGTAFLANTSRLIGEISKIIGKESQPYFDYYEQVKIAFQKTFLTDSGSLTAHYQGTYVLALAFDLLDDVNKNGALNHLIKLIEQNNYKLDTGFLSVPYLLDVLCDNGYEDIALKIFFQRDCPSWFYEIDRGATTIWESWAGIQPDGKVMDHSFNHYAFGCVGDWVIRRIAGFELKSVGYKQFNLAPIKNSGIKYFSLNYQSPFGQIKIERDDTVVNLDIPHGVEGFIQTKEGEQLIKSGKHSVLID